MIKAPTLLSQLLPFGEHNPCCSLVSDRLDEGLRVAGVLVDEESRARFIIAFAEALLRDLREARRRKAFVAVFPGGEFSYPEGFPLPLSFNGHPGRIHLEAYKTCSAPDREIARLEREIALEESDPTVAERTINDLFGNLLCAGSVKQWQQRRSDGWDTSWHVVGAEIGRTERRKGPPFLDTTVARAWVIAAHDLYGSTINEAIARAERHPALWGKGHVEGRYSRTDFQTEYGRIRERYPTGHEDPKYRATEPTVSDAELYPEAHEEAMR